MWPPNFVGTWRSWPAVPQHERNPIDLERRLHWIGQEVPAAILMNGRIVAGQAFLTRSGGIVRWAGGFDLLRLAELALAIQLHHASADWAPVGNRDQQ